MELIKGRRNIITVTVTDNEVIFPLTGYQAELVIATGSGAAPELQKEGTILTPENGVVVFTILPADLEAAREGRFKYEINIWKTADKTVAFTPNKGIIDIIRGLDETPTVQE
jgi:hypothetical protein